MSGALTSISTSPPSSLPLPELELLDARLRATPDGNTVLPMRLHRCNCTVAMAPSANLAARGGRSQIWTPATKGRPRAQTAICGSEIDPKSTATAQRLVPRHSPDRVAAPRLTVRKRVAEDEVCNVYQCLRKREVTPEGEWGDEKCKRLVKR